MPDLKVEKDKENAKKNEALKITGAEFGLKIEQFRKLKERKILSETEFVLKKREAINDLSSRIIASTYESFLADLIPLVDDKTLTTDDIDAIKEALSSPTNQDTEVKMVGKMLKFH